MQDMAQLLQQLAQTGADISPFIRTKFAVYGDIEVVMDVFGGTSPGYIGRATFDVLVKTISDAPRPDFVTFEEIYSRVTADMSSQEPILRYSLCDQIYVGIRLLDDLALHNRFGYSPCSPEFIKRAMEKWEALSFIDLSPVILEPRPVKKYDKKKIDANRVEKSDEGKVLILSGREARLKVLKERFDAIGPGLTREAAAKALGESYGNTCMWGRAVRYEFTRKKSTSMQDANAKWANVNWNLTDAEIAKEMQVTRGRVHQLRRLRSPQPPTSPST